MAWTEEARAAAAETRRQHSQQKGYFSKVGKFNISATTSKEGRNEIANQLKRVRAGKMAILGHTSDSRINQIVTNAAASTRLRNIARMTSASNKASSKTPLKLSRTVSKPTSRSRK